MTYRQLLRAIEHAQDLVKYIEDIEPVWHDVGNDQRGYRTEDLAEIRRLEALLDEEIDVS